MAIELAGNYNVPIVLLHVRKPVPTGLGQPNAEELLEYLTVGAEAVMDHYRKRLENAKIEFTDLVIGGDVAEVIANVCDVESVTLSLSAPRASPTLKGLFSAPSRTRCCTRLPVPFGREVGIGTSGSLASRGRISWGLALCGVVARRRIPVPSFQVGI